MFECLKRSLICKGLRHASVREYQEKLGLKRSLICKGLRLSIYFLAHYDHRSLKRSLIRKGLRQMYFTD